MAVNPLRGTNLLVANLFLAFAYVLAGYLGLKLALPPGYASPLFPPAGIALASLYSGGLGLLPGVFLGSLSLSVIVTYPGGDPASVVTLLSALSTAIGAMLQACIGQLLLARRVRPDLGGARDVLWFLLVAPLASVVSASVSLFALLLLGAIAPAALPQAWITWWVGDTIGVLLAAPLCWIAFGQPRALWWRRRMLVGLPLVVAIGVFVAIYEQAVQWERDQQLQTYRLKAQQVGDLLQSQLSELEHFLATMAIAMQSPNEPESAEEFDHMAGTYLFDRPALSGMAWAPRVTPAERMRFERQNGAVLHDLAGTEVGALTRDAYPVRFIAPLKSSNAVGFDLVTDPVRAEALQRALRSHRTVVSAPARLLRPNSRGLLMFQTVRIGAGASGLLCLAIQPEVYLQTVIDTVRFPYLRVELQDLSVDGAPELLAGTLGAQTQPAELSRMISFGGREYRLRLAPTTEYLSQHRGWQSWSVLTGGLLLTGLLGALLLLVSAERVRIQALVDDRTAKLREREARLQAILDGAADAILTVDHAGMIMGGNRAAGALFGYLTDTLSGLPLAALLNLTETQNGAAPLLAQLSSADGHSLELTGRTSGGATLPLAIAVNAVDLPDEHAYVVIAHDLTEQQRAQERIHRLAHHDPLTGLDNRFSLNLHLEQILQLARRGEEAVAVLFIDLDHFKKINDSQGHEAGDQLLIQVAQRLRELLREMDVIARLGGDEFIVVMGGNPSPDAVRAVAVRIVDALSAPFELSDKVAHSGASVGVAMFPGDGQDTGTLLRHADMAMYAAKGQGRGNFQFFSAAMNAATHERLQLESQLRQALSDNQFELFLQPQVSLRSGRVIGAEALLRWRHPERGIVSPDRFIPIAEESGLILPLGEWVLAEATRLLADWRAAGHGTLRLAVNLSARQCHVAGLLPLLDGLVAEHAIDPALLELEITESAAMQDPERTRHLLRSLRERGFKVAIDDFGTGYSSLSYLKLFAIDRIKIDRSFVKDIETDPNDAVIVGATIALAHSLGLEVIAEGVETAAQRDFLAAKRCEDVQGYLYAKPLPQAEFEQFLEASLDVAGQ